MALPPVTCLVNSAKPYLGTRSRPASVACASSIAF